MYIVIFVLFGTPEFATFDILGMKMEIIVKTTITSLKRMKSGMSVVPLD